MQGTEENIGENPWKSLSTIKLLPGHVPLRFTEEHINSPPYAIGFQIWKKMRKKPKTEGDLAVFGRPHGTILQPVGKTRNKQS